MVMHARKQPRVNDGYTERKDAHLHQWLDRHQSMQNQQKGYGGMYGDRSPAEGSHGHSARGDSPGGRPSPRYQNKPPYTERNKERRGSLNLATTKVNQYLATGSIGQNAPSSHRDLHEREQDHDPHEEGNGDGSHQGGQDKMPVARRDSSKDGKDKDHRVEVQKSAVRVCGDWSEHISSSGKRYYYNCKTEVSQWEKPKEWNDAAKPPDRSKDGRGPARPSSSSTHPRGGDERARHSSVGERHDLRYRPESSSSAPADKQSQKLSERPKSYSMDAPNSSSATAGSNSLRSSTIQRSDSVGEPIHSHNHAGYSSHGGHSGYPGHSGHQGHTSHPELKRNSVYHGSSSGEPGRRRIRHESENSRGVMGHGSRNDDGGQIDDMDISPGSTPTSSRPSSCTGTPSMPPNSTPGYGHPANSMPHASPSVVATPSHLATSVASLLSTPQGQEPDLNRKAIETLQELQKALSLHIKAQQSKGGPPITSSSTGATSAQLQSQLSHLQHNIASQLQHHQQQQHHLGHPHHSVVPPHMSPHHPHAALPPGAHLPDEGMGRDRDGRESPGSDISARSSCRSPTPSTGSSQHAHTIGTSALSVAALKSQQSVNLTPSLSNYYNEKLIGHVLGWQAEYLERQAERFRHESLALGSLHCSRVSVEQKKARSLVRTAEIQSTIYEQRILVLQQQRAEIENLKPPTSLLPS